MRRLCQLCDEPLALTSANVSSQTSTVAVSVSPDIFIKCALKKSFLSFSIIVLICLIVTSVLQKLGV